MKMPERRRQAEMKIGMVVIDCNTDMEMHWEAREFHTPSLYPKIVKDYRPLIKKVVVPVQVQAYFTLFHISCSIGANPKFTFTPVLSNLSDPRCVEILEIYRAIKNTYGSELELTRSLMNSDDFTLRTPFPKILQRL